MFKKVFISLLILSALSADGTNNTPLDIYSIYFNYAALLEASADEVVSSDVLSEDTAFSMLSEDEPVDTLIDTRSKNKNITAKDSSTGVNIPDIVSLLYVIDTISEVTANNISKRAVIQKADSSPPCCLV